MFEPITKITSLFSTSSILFVIAPLPNVGARPATVDECHKRAQ
ncbi:hypothetical protein Q5M85_02465 [Paraclostridium bifermentans]|nr:hypothetical protein [Paraclostridium bifermentans]